MSDEEVEHFLRSFEERIGRIRGKTLNEKVDQLRARYLKTALDCRKEIEAGLDKSIYRSAYAAAHEDVGNMLINFDESADYLNSEVIVHLVSLVKDEMRDKTPASTGNLDAYGYMIAELRKAVEESNV